MGSSAARQARVAERTPARRTGRRRDRFRRAAIPYLFVSPALLILTAFWTLPMLFSFYLAFTRWSGLGSPEWVGLLNFRVMLHDDEFRQAAENTVWYAVAAVVVLVPLGLGLALLLNSHRVKGRVAIRALIFMPGIAATVAVAVIFSLILDTNYGVLNSALHGMGLGRVGWLSSASLAKPAILSLVVWGGVGFTMLYYLAGLQTVPLELMEAAHVDGASRFRAFRHVVLPLLRPTTIFVIVVTTINTLQILVEPFILTQGGPNDATLSAGLLLYYAGFNFGELGYASAIGLTIFAVTLVVSIIQVFALGLFRES